MTDNVIEFKIKQKKTDEEENYSSYVLCDELAAHYNGVGAMFFIDMGAGKGMRFFSAGIEHTDQLYLLNNAIHYVIAHRNNLNKIAEDFDSDYK